MKLIKLKILKSAICTTVKACSLSLLTKISQITHKDKDIHTHILQD